MLVSMRQIHHLPPALFPSKPTTKSCSTPKLQIQSKNFDSCHGNECSQGVIVADKIFNPSICANLLLSAAVSLALIAPLSSSAIPSFSSKSSLPSTATPFSQAKNLPTGLEDGKIRPCPSINPGCVSSNPKSSNFAFPWSIPGNLSDNSAIQQLQDAIFKTQKNVKILVVEDTPKGKYLRAEINGGFGRDVLEFLISGDVVSFRAMATKVTYVYPFTTALGDSKGQEERMRRILSELGWYAPSLDSME